MSSNINYDEDICVLVKYSSVIDVMAQISVIDVVALPAVIDVLACVSYDFSRVIFSNYVKKPE